MILIFFIKILKFFRLIHTELFKKYYRKKFASGGETAFFYGKNLPIIKGEMNIHLGRGVKLNEFAYLYARNNAKIYIGDHSTISSFATLITAGYEINQWVLEKPGDLKDIHVQRDIIIGKHCWIASKAIILPGVEIRGTNVVVAAGAIVTRSYDESNIVLGGAPAKIIKRI